MIDKKFYNFQQKFLASGQEGALFRQTTQSGVWDWVARFESINGFQPAAYKRHMFNGKTVGLIAVGEYSMYWSATSNWGIIYKGRQDISEMQKEIQIRIGMNKLIPKEIKRAFKAQGYTGNKSMADIKIVCKLFNPYGAGTWYLYEHVEEDIYMCFAYLGDSQCAECGTVSLRELASVKLPFGGKIERDRYYGGGTLQEVWDEYKKQ